MKLLPLLRVVFCAPSVFTQTACVWAYRTWARLTVPPSSPLAKHLTGPVLRAFSVVCGLQAGLLLWLAVLCLFALGDPLPLRASPVIAWAQLLCVGWVSASMALGSCHASLELWRKPENSPAA